MLDRIIAILKESAADAWEAESVRETGWEFYFIRHALDQNRVRNTDHIRVTVYKRNKEEDTIGSASMLFSPTTSPKEAEKGIEDLIYRASLVKNRNYTLAPMRPAEPLEMQEEALEKTAKDFLDTMNRIEETETEDLNSYEIFTSHVSRRFVNSEGVDFVETYPKSMAEVVVNARDNGKEIELYRMYHCGTCDSEGLKREVEATMRYGRDRLHVKPTPQIPDASVIFSTKASLQIYEYFLDNMNAMFICRQMNDWTIGKPITDSCEGDRVTLKAVRYFPDSSANHMYDSEGAPVRDRTIIENNVPKAYWGSRQAACYIGLDDSFVITNWEVSGGTKSADEIRTGNYLEVVEFSDFQVDSVTGDIFGEIRLAYLHDENGTVPVSGGSVSGSMKQLADRMTMSVETRQWDSVSYSGVARCARIPSVTRLDGVTVTGQ